MEVVVVTGGVLGSLVVEMATGMEARSVVRTNPRMNQRTRPRARVDAAAEA
jgi:hypothetical protein